MMTILLRYVVRDVLRSKWLALYLTFFAAVTEGLLYFTAGEAKTVIGLMNVVLLLIPLAAVVFGTLHVHHNRDFVELMLTQPVSRPSIFGALYLGVALPFMAAFVIGVGVPSILHGVAFTAPFQALIGTGCALTMVFFAIAYFVGVAIQDKATAMGAAFLLWLLFGVVYDGVILGVTVAFADYPLEMATIGMIVGNPIDLARIIVMLTFDYAALMGYTGAVFQQFFGTTTGIMVSTLSLALWTLIPVYAGYRTFCRKDW
ncbi:MAG: ABC transporter permease [Candidatus Kapabacteria bacterium]|nr:ABC transporter permease [Candidatus Kapabacteria bacterium]